MIKEFNFKFLYLYAASFTALLFFLFGAISSVTNLVSLTNGEDYYQTYTQFKMMNSKEGEQIFLEDDEVKIRQAYEEEARQYESTERKRTIENLSGSLTALLLGVFFWQFFWRQTKNSNK